MTRRPPLLVRAAIRAALILGAATGLAVLIYAFGVMGAI